MTIFCESPKSFLGKNFLTLKISVQKSWFFFSDFISGGKSIRPVIFKIIPKSHIFQIFSVFLTQCYFFDWNAGNWNQAIALLYPFQNMSNFKKQIGIFNGEFGSPWLVMALFLINKNKQRKEKILRLNSMLKKKNGHQKFF